MLNKEYINGSPLTAEEYMNFKNEVSNVITLLSDFGLSTDLNNQTQLATALQEVLLKGNIYVDSGVANQYIVNPITNTNISVSAYKVNMQIKFIALNSNTTTSTINFCNLGSKTIKRFDGTTLQSNDIKQGYIVELIYDSVSDSFILVNSSLFQINKLLANTIESPSLYNENILDNGNCYINQRATSFSVVNNTYGFPVDRFTCKVSATTSASGTITQIDATIKDNGKAIKFTTITTTGATGTSSIRQRICGQDAVLYKNQYLSFHALIKHDMGSTIPFTIYIRKPTVYNDFTTTTEISNKIINVSNVQTTTLKYENFNVGDCSNGLEIEIVANHGAITNRNIEITNLKLEKGTTITNFRDESYINNLNKCLAYYQEIASSVVGKARDGNTGGYGYGYRLSIYYQFNVIFIKTPNIIYFTHNIGIFLSTGSPPYTETTSIYSPSVTNKYLIMTFQPVTNNINFSTYGGDCSLSAKLSAEL